MDTTATKKNSAHEWNYKSELTKENMYFSVPHLANL